MSKIEDTGITIKNLFIPGYTADLILGFIMKYVPDATEAIGINETTYFDFPITVRLNYIFSYCKEENNKLPGKEFLKQVLKRESVKITEMVFKVMNYPPEMGTILAGTLKEMTHSELLRVWKNCPNEGILFIDSCPTGFLPLLLVEIESGKSGKHRRDQFGGYKSRIEKRLKEVE